MAEVLPPGPGGGAIRRPLGVSPDAQTSALTSSSSLTSRRLPPPALLQARAGEEEQPGRGEAQRPGRPGGREGPARAPAERARAQRHPRHLKLRPLARRQRAPQGGVVVHAASPHRSLLEAAAGGGGFCFCFARGGGGHPAPGATFSVSHLQLDPCDPASLQLDPLAGASPSGPRGTQIAAPARTASQSASLPR